MKHLAIALLLLSLSPTAFGDAYTEIGANAGEDGLTGTSPAWHSEEIDWLRHEADSTTWHAALGRVERFDLSDDYATAGGFLPLSATWKVDGELSVSPDHQVLPRYQATAGVEYDFPSAWNLQASFRHSSYSDATGNIVSAGVEHYFGDWRASYTLIDGTTSGASGAAHVVNGDWYYGDRSYVGGGFVTGQEVDRVSPTTLVKTDVRGFFVSGKHAFSPAWSVTYAYGVTALQDFYTRRGVSIGLNYRF